MPEKSIRELARERHSWSLTRQESAEQQLRELAAGDPLPFVALLSDANPRVRRTAAWALRLSGRPEALEPLMGALHDRDSGTRHEAEIGLRMPFLLKLVSLDRARAAEVLLAQLVASEGVVDGGTIDPDLVTLGRDAVVPLVKAVGRYSGGVRRAAIATLEMIPAVSWPLLKGLQKSDEELLLGMLRWAQEAPPVRERVVDGWVSLGSGCAPLLMALLRNHGSWLRLWVVTALGRMRYALAEPVFAALAGDNDPLAGLAGAVGLAHLGDARGVDCLLRALLEEHDQEARLTAVEALGALGAPASVALESLRLRRQSDAYPEVRAACKLAIRRIEAALRTTTAELEWAAAPGGTGLEPEAASAPAGRGSEPEADPEGHQPRR